MRVGNANAAAGATLDDHFMATMRELAYALGNESDAIFLNFDLFGYTNSHCETFSLQMYLSGRGRVGAQSHGKLTQCTNAARLSAHTPLTQLLRGRRLIGSGRAPRVLQTVAKLQHSAQHFIT